MNHTEVIIDPYLFHENLTFLKKRKKKKDNYEF